MNDENLPSFDIVIDSWSNMRRAHVYKVVAHKNNLEKCSRDRIQLWLW